MTPQRILRPALTLLRVAIVVGVVWLLATKVDYQKLLATARHASFPLLIASVGVFFGDYLIKTWKWELLLNGQGIRVPFWQLFKVSMKGYFISFFAPSAITADLYKGVALFTEVGAGHTVMSSIVLERLLGMTSIVIVNLVAISLLPATLFGLNSAVSLIVVAAATAAILTGFLHADRVAAVVLRWLPHRWHRVTVSLEQLAGAFAEYRSKRGLLTVTLLMSFGLQVTRSSATWIIARAVHDQTPFWAFLLFVPYLYIVNLLPLSTSRFGLEQGAFVVLFGAVGMKAETALTVSLLSVFATMLISLPGAFWLATDRLLPKRAARRGVGTQSRSRVIVHADDFGETVEITKGIVAGIEAGGVTSTSILANMPGTPYALEEARRLGRRASFGVHLNLCEGYPLAPGASFTRPDGRFVSKRTLAVRAFTGRLDLEEIRRELAAQIVRIREDGVEISHLDSHKHLHQLPGVARVVASLATELGLQRVRCTLEEDAWPAGTRLVPGLSRLARRELAQRLARELDARSVRYPARTLDLAHLMRLPREAQREMLIRPGTVSEMFCHPGTPEADREKPGSCDRAGELEFLRSQAFVELRRDANVELITYWEL